MSHNPWLSNTLIKIEAATSAFRGPKYLGALVLCLTRVLQVQFALVTERLPGPPARGRALAFADANNKRQPFVYDTSIYPCSTVLEGLPVAVPCNVAELFPGATEISAYVGHPLRNLDGDVFGLVAIEHTQKLDNSDAIAQLMQLLSGRVAAELECVVGAGQRRSTTPGAPAQP